ncbi:Rap/ran-GAP family protein [Trichomonas vaginalis G3]|uniref:Rap/ran-GAP family protein n=1 Tax=Trichomonas vaginalis (strain ATCC PRA-98 / G3) TaxID=412133 RepID=A2FCZ0_TRIV3|nr:GTPase activator protein [Trichomonas vaginalis G3]EAX97228.1 Rap/ran-GAP family protein [Trichomonas vaginalis G3]KAI5509535.1 GTPase activator protein [Trichomonas vaginalis G3]|eukprot:XP_001310158.1 Rap/ran-GAP family protein [Trichomonas vaginalis G3]
MKNVLDGLDMILKAVDLGDSSTMNTVAMEYVALLNAELENLLNYKQKCGSSSEGLIIKYIKAISKLINYKISSNSIDSGFDFRILFDLFPKTLISQSNNYTDKLWKAYVDLFSLLFHIPVINHNQFEIPISNIFHYGAPTQGNLYVNFFIRRFEVILNAIFENYPTTITLWLNFLSQTVFYKFFNYYNGNVNSSQLLLDQPLPSKFYDSILDLMQSRQFIDFYEIFNHENTFPTHFLFLLHLIIKIEDENHKKYPKQVDILAKKWTNLDTVYKQEVLRLFKNNCPQEMINLLILLSRKTVLSLQPLVRNYTDGNSLIEREKFPVYQSIMSEFQNNYLFIIDRHPSFQQCDLNCIVKDFFTTIPIIGLVFYFNILFNFKVENADMFSLPKECMNSIPPAVSILASQVFMSIVGCCFSPILFDFSIDPVTSYVNKVNGKVSRGKAAPQNFLPDMEKIFTDNFVFSMKLLSIYNKEMLKPVLDFAGLNRILFSPLVIIGWTYDKALKWIKNFINFQPQSIETFLTILNEIQKIIPIYLQKNHNFVFQNFFPQIIYYLDKYSPSSMIFDAISNFAKLDGVASSTIADPMIAHSWISVLCKFLCSTDNNTVSVAFRSAIQSIIKFLPQSMILITLILHILVKRVDIISFEEIEQYILNSYVICGYYLPKVDKIFDLEAVSKNWPKNSYKPKLVRDSINDFENQSFSIQKTLISQLGNSFKAKSFNSTASVYVQEAIEPGSPLLDFIMRSFEIYFTSNDSKIDIRLLSLLSSQYIGKNSPNSHFIRKFCKYMLDEFESTDDPRDRWLLFLALSHLVKLGVIDIKKLTKKLHSLHVHDNKSLQTMVEAFPFIFDKKPYYSDRQEPTDVILSIDNSKLFQVSVIDEETHILDSRTVNFVDSRKITNISKKPVISQNNISLPEEENDSIDEIENEDHNVFRTYFFEKFNCQETSPTNFEIFSSSRKESTEFNLDVRPPINLVSVQSPETSRFSEIISKVPSFSPIYWSLYKFANMRVFDCTPSSLRETKAIFQSGTREEIKIGVLYVKDGQFTQNEILANKHQDASLSYDKFVRSLGTPVSLKDHLYFNAKLDQSVSPFSIFYSDDEYDVMFHVSTLMKTSDDDPQQLAKKRHIGNDNVHIVWCENKSGYDPDTILSNFNDAHIIVYPFNDDLYHVVVHKKNKNLEFGPLPSGVLVKSRALAPLVRMTAINADRVVRKDLDQMPDKRFASLMKPLCG